MNPSAAFFLPPTTLSAHQLSFVWVIQHWDEERGWPLRWHGEDFYLAWRPHRARHALLPLAQRPLVGVTPPADRVPFTHVPAPTHGKARWDYVQNALRGAGRLYSNTTGLIPIEKPVIPHLQCQISPQSFLLFWSYYSPVWYHISRRKKKEEKRNHYERKSARERKYRANLSC